MQDKKKTITIHNIIMVFMIQTSKMRLYNPIIQFIEQKKMLFKLLYYQVVSFQNIYYIKNNSNSFPHIIKFFIMVLIYMQTEEVMQVPEPPTFPPINLTCICQNFIVIQLIIKIHQSLHFTGFLLMSNMILKALEIMDIE